MKTALEYICDCGLEHNYKLKIISDEIDDTELSSVMPAGVKAIFLGSNHRLKRRISRFYRTDSIEELLIGEEKLDIMGREFSKEITKLRIPEDVKLVVSHGEYIPLGKYIASISGARHIVCGGGNLSSSEFVLDKVFQLKNLGCIDRVIKTEEDINLPSSFAFAINILMTLFDWDISALLFGQTLCTEIFTKAQKTISTLMDAVKQLPKRSTMLKKEMLNAHVELSSLIQAVGQPLLVSGATQAAAALTMLYKHEKRELIDIFDISFLLSPLVAKIYQAFLDSSLPFCFPANNNLHASKMHEYLGVDKLLSHQIQPDYPKRKEIELIEYRLNMYKEELLKHLCGIINILEQAYPIYFRLHEDDGFALQGFMSSLDSSLALALGCDVLKGNTLLNYLRVRGFLDRYLL